MNFYKIVVLFILIGVSSQNKIVESEFKVLPDIVFFDLDFTLWPYWVDTTAIPPFEKNDTTGKIEDSKGKVIEYYPEVPAVFKYLNEHSISIGICSSTIAVKESKQLLELFGWQKYFTIEEIYPISKDIHLKKLQEKNKLKLGNILFFDDEPHIHKRMKHIKVISIPVIDGMTMKVLKSGLKKFSNIRSIK